jgi:hypothetical protein
MVRFITLLFQRQYEGEVYLDQKTGSLHWPVMFLYEEHNQSDFIRDFDENHTFEDHLAYMFSSDNLPSWDTERKYLTENLEIYAQLGVAIPLKEREKVQKRWIKIKRTTALKTILSHADYVVPHFPVFYILAANSRFKKVRIWVSFLIF